MKNLLKGILLWTTIILTTLLILGANSIADKGILVLIIWSVVCFALQSLCKRYISEEELYILLKFH